MYLEGENQGEEEEGRRNQGRAADSGRALKNVGARGTGQNAAERAEEGKDERQGKSRKDRAGRQEGERERGRMKRRQKTERASKIHMEGKRWRRSLTQTGQGPES